MHLISDMAPSLVEIPELYFVAQDDPAVPVDDPYMALTLRPTVAWEHTIRCFTSWEAARKQALQFADTHPVRLFSAAGVDLANWFAYFTVDVANPPLLETIPIDFNMVHGAKILSLTNELPRQIDGGLFGDPDYSMTTTPAKGRTLLLTGAHGAGKSTLAELLSTRYQLPLYASYAGPFQRLWGTTAQQTVPFTRRLMIQRHILKKWCLDYTHATTVTGGIFDRTAYDIAAYLLADITRDDTGTALSEAVQLFTATALQVMQTAQQPPRQVTCVHVPLLPVMQTNRGADKAPEGGYAQLLDMLIRGLIASHDAAAKAPEILYLDPQTDDLQQRLRQITTLVDRQIAA